MQTHRKFVVMWQRWVLCDLKNMKIIQKRPEMRFIEKIEMFEKGRKKAQNYAKSPITTGNGVYTQFLVVFHVLVSFWRNFQSFKKYKFSPIKPDLQYF